jgi:hypothetical protein
MSAVRSSFRLAASKRTPGALGMRRVKAMTAPRVHGPVDFVLIEFPDDHLTGRAAEELLNLVDRDIVHLFDVLIVGKQSDGTTYTLDLAEAAEQQLGGFANLAGANTGLLSDEDMQEAAAVLEPGKLAVLIVYENSWAVPFVAAAMESGGELIAGARIPAADVTAALDALEAAESIATP